MLPVLQIYAQSIWHGDAYIVGDRDALMALRRAIDAALLDGYGRASAMVSDCEGFYTFVLCATDEAIDDLRLPYSDPMASGRDEDGEYGDCSHPEDLLPKDAWRS